MNRLRIPVASRPRKLQSVLGLGSGPEGRIEKIRTTVTELLRHERLEGSYRVLDESRGYVELLIQQAIMHGHKHQETMELADYYLLEKDLVQKLFKVLVPRYKDTQLSYTQQHQLPNAYPENSRKAVLELRGNPWPPVIEDPVATDKWINNVLLDAVRKNMDSIPNKTKDNDEASSALNEDQTGGTAV